MRNKWIVALVATSAGCMGTTTVVRQTQPTTQVNVAVNITIGQPLEERDVRVALAQHGRWQSTTLGELWIPAVAEREEFVPFATHGQWVETARGPSWSSTFSWGPIVFHYGQWRRAGGVWGWSFDRAFGTAPVRWRRAGAHVGWSVATVDEWCWLALEELYGPSPWRRAMHGRAAAPLFVSSTEVEVIREGLAFGWAPPGGIAPSGSSTTSAAMRIESEAPSGRWGTVVIRDERARENFEELQQYEQSPPATLPSNAVSNPSAVVRARFAPAVARSNGSSTLWSDQERSRAPTVANIQPTFTPHAPGFAQSVVPAAMPAQVVVAPQPAGPQPTTIASGSTPSSAGFASTGVVATVPSSRSSTARVAVPAVVRSAGESTVRR